MKPKPNILLGVTGSIASYKVTELIKDLREAEFNINVIMTKNALKFITPLTLETISNNRVYTELFEEKHEFLPEHISLAEKADLILICPATACILGKLACGICDDLLTCTLFASKAPVLICPAMNENMYKNKIIQENITKLKRLGYKFVPPIKGRLACGKTGIGHLAEVDTIVREVKKILNTK